MIQSDNNLELLSNYRIRPLTLFPQNYSNYLKSIDGFSSEQLEEEIERLKTRRSIVAVDVIPRIDRMISAATAMLERQQSREAGGPSQEALEHIQAEVDNRRKRDNKVASAIAHLEAKQIRRNRFGYFFGIGVLLAIAITVAILASRP